MKWNYSENTLLLLFFKHKYRGTINNATTKLKQGCLSRSICHAFKCFVRRDFKGEINKNFV